MALVNHHKKEINAKIVFFGPPAAGKGTTLNAIYRKLKPDHRGPLKSMAIQGDRMLFFDLTPPGGGGMDGYTVRFHLYTLTGEVSIPSSWKMVLKGVDGIIFVADSSVDSLPENLDYLDRLREHLRSLGRNLDDLPLILQYNKRDLPGVLSLEELESAINRGQVVSAPASAARGEGVLDSFSRLIRMVMNSLKDAGMSIVKGEDQFPLVHDEEVETSSKPPSEAPLSSPESARVEVAASERTAVMPQGQPKVLSDGRLVIPLTVRCDGCNHQLSITVTVSLKDNTADE